MRASIRKHRLVLAVLAAAVSFCLFVGRPWAYRLARQQVASQLFEANGGPVQFDRVSLGLRSLTIHDVQLFEPRDSHQVWCSIDRIWLNISLWNAMRGKTNAEHAILFDPVVRLRLADDGKLLNRFRSANGGIHPPAKLIEVRNAVVNIEQAARPALQMCSADLRLRQAGNEFLLQGEMSDLLKTQWTVEASLDATALGLTGRLSTESIRCTTADIASLPLVKLDLRSYGDFFASGAIDASMSWNGQEVDYEAVFVAETLRGELRNYGIETTIHAGKVVVKNNRLTVSDVRGTLLDGEYVVNGRLDLTKSIGDAEFKFDNVHTSAAPEHWKVPPEVTAIFDGKAHLGFERRNANWDLRGGVETQARNVGAFGLTPESLTLNVEFTTPPTRDDTLPFGVAGMARMHIAVSDIDAKSLRTGWELSNRWRGISSDVDSHGQNGNLPPIWPKLAEIDGRVSLQGDFQLPLATADELETLGGEGWLESPMLGLSGVSIRDFVARVSLSAGTVSFTDARAEVLAGEGNAAGTITSQGRLRVFPLDDLQLTAELHDLPLSLPLKLIGHGSDRVPDGNVNTSLSAQVPLSQVAQPAAWKVQGKLTAPAIRFAEHQADAISADYQVEQGALRLLRSSANWCGARLRCRGDLGLAPPYEFTVQGVVEHVNLPVLAQQITPLRQDLEVVGVASATAVVHGSLDPLSWSGAGEGAIPKVTFADVQVGNSRFDWQVDTKEARITDFQADLFGGTATLNATYAFGTTPASSLHGALASADLAAIAGLAQQLPVNPRGRVSTQLNVRNWHNTEQATASAQFESEQVDVWDAVLSRVVGTLEFANQSLTLDATADALGGRVRVTGGSSIPALTQTVEEANASSAGRMTGEITLKQFPIEQLIRVASRDPLLEPLSGVADAILQVQLDSDWRPHASGRTALRNVRWGRHAWSSELQGQLTLTGDLLRLAELSGDFAGGRLRFNSDLTLGKRPSGTFRIGLDRVEASKVLVPIRVLAASMEGPIDARIQGTVSQEWNGRAQFSMGRGAVLKLPFSRLRAPIDWSFSPARQRLSVRASNVTAQLGSGQVAGRIDMSWGSRLAMEASARARNIELRSLLRNVPNVSSIGAGRISGTARVAGQNVASADDLAGSFEADLSQLQPFQLPVLRQMSRFVPPVQPTASFDSGKAKGRLSNGVVYFDRTTIEGGVAQLLLEGSATLRGRLDLDVTAKTGDLTNAPAGLTRLIRTPMTLAAPVPLSLLAEANEFLAERLVFLHVGGTVKRPVVQLRPGRQLQQEAIQFFLLRGANAAIRDQVR